MVNPSHGNGFHPVFGNAGGTASAAAAGGGGAVTYVPGKPVVREPHSASYIEDHETLQAQSMIDELFRDLTKTDKTPEGLTFRDHCRLTRYFAAVKIYVRPEEIKVGPDGAHSIILPDSVRSEDRYQSCAGLVIALGPQAFQDKDGNPRGTQYRVGDWLLFPRTDIVRVDFCGIPIGVMTDDRAIAVVSDPTHWQQGSLTFKG